MAEAEIVPEEEKKEELSSGEIPENLDESGNVVEKPEVEEEEKVEEEEEPEEEEKPVSRRENLRIQALTEKLREKEAAAAATPKRPGGLDYAKELDADEETVKTLSSDRESYGKALYEEGIKRAESIQFHTRLEIDAPRVESKYPQLDKSSKEFNPALANALNTMYLGAVGYDEKSDTVVKSNIRYADYIESMMELADEIAVTRNIKTTKNVAKQAAQTGLRPDGSSAKRLNLNKAPEDMTNEELEAVIAQAIPQVKR